MSVDLLKIAKKAVYSISNAYTRRNSDVFEDAVYLVNCHLLTIVQKNPSVNNCNNYLTRSAFNYAKRLAKEGHTSGYLGVEKEDVYVGIDSTYVDKYCKYSTFSQHTQGFSLNNFNTESNYVASWDPIDNITETIQENAELDIYLSLCEYLIENFSPILTDIEVAFLLKTKEILICLIKDEDSSVLVTKYFYGKFSVIERFCEKLPQRLEIISYKCQKYLETL